jgi:hypothetical protein
VNEYTISDFRKDEYFSDHIWTADSALNRLANFVVWRRRFLTRERLSGGETGRARSTDSRVGEKMGGRQVTRPSINVLPSSEDTWPSRANEARTSPTFFFVVVVRLNRAARVLASTAL